MTLELLYFAKQISHYTKDDLEGMSLKDIKTLCKGCPIRGYSKLRKADLIGKLLEVIELHNSQNQTKVSHKRYDRSSDYEISDNDLANSAFKVIKRIALDDSTYKAQESRTLQLSTLAAKLNGRLTGIYKSSTINSLVSKALKLLDEKIEKNDDEAIQDRLETLTIIFKRVFNAAVDVHREQAKKIREKGLDRRHSEKIVVPNLSELIAWARTVLSSPETYRWELVSSALALVTGRRMAEIHSTLEIEPGPDNRQCYVSGLVKVRDDKNRKRLIPIWADFDDVNNGLRNLEKEDRRILPDDYEKENKLVNQKYSMQLSRVFSVERALTTSNKFNSPEKLAIKNPLAGVNVPLQYLLDKNTAESKREYKDKSFHYHTCRAVYANLSDIFINDDRMDTRKYMGEILGHVEDRKNSSAANYSILNMSAVKRMTLEEFEEEIESQIPYQDEAKYVISHK